MSWFTCFLRVGVLCLELTGAFAASANRFVNLDDFCDIYYPNQSSPKLTTPQWIGEPGVEAALVLAIDDMREPQRYENYLRPILDRLKEIDGRAPVSIMSCQVDPNDPQLQKWLAEGVSIEAHTIDHPCPILDKGDFAAAKSTYDRCVDLFWTVPNSRPVAFRTPCMDGINSASPRLFAEIMMGTTANGHFLSISSSVGMLFTPADPENPKELVLDANGKPRFNKYLLPGYINYIENYPYPYLIGNRFWESGFSLPDDYEASRVFGDKSPSTIADMEAAIDTAVAKKGIWVMTFHPYNWIDNRQIVELIDHTVRKHGRKAKFLNLHELHERLEANLLAGQSIRAPNGAENGIRLLDLNSDGYLDAIVANEHTRQTRLWNPSTDAWTISDFPTSITEKGQPRGVRFGVVAGAPCAFLVNGRAHGFWRWAGDRWTNAPEFLSGLELRGARLATANDKGDQGVRFRDVDEDGNCELIASTPDGTEIFDWSPAEKTWKKMDWAWPERVSIVTADGLDNGVRFVDFNHDGYQDLIFSNESEYGLWLAVPKLYLGFRPGWSRQILRGKRGENPSIPMISRGGDFRNNGAWFARDTMWVQNEDTAKLPDLVERVSYRDLLNGFQPPAKAPREALESMVIDPAYRVELAAQEPAVQDPVAFEWGADGTLWVVEMRDYPLGVDGKPGGAVRRLRDEDGDGFYETSSVFLAPIPYPNGVMPWKNGLLISTAPNILFAEDLNGDGKADRTEVLFRGFREGNQQHRLNGFELGLDGWLYGANGDSGGLIESVKTGSTVSISGHDFRFKPDSGEFQAISGQTQFGRRRDDWGNWFGGANYTWGWHYVCPEEYLERNPSLAIKSPKRTLNTAPDGSRVFPISRVQQRFNDIGMAGHVTSACSFAPYRDELFGPEFEHGLLISEPTHNLVHREVLEPDGVSFHSHRARGEQTLEFLASTDPWFRPTSIKTGPDGAIYIADMYRLVIEHPEWIPPDAQERMDLRAGAGMGRIYRIRPTGKALRKPSRFENRRQILAALESPNGWERDTAQRLLIEAGARDAAPALAEILRSSPNRKGRLQALCTLACLGTLDQTLLASALRDSHPVVRAWAVRLSEPAPGSAAPLSSLLLERVKDSDLRVRYQLAYSLGEWNDPRVPEALAQILQQDPRNEDIATAVLSSSSECGNNLLLAVLRAGSKGAQVERVVNHLIGQLKSPDHEETIRQAAAVLEQSLGGDQVAGWKLTALARLLDLAPPTDDTQRALLRQRARDLAADPSASDQDRIAVLPILDARGDSGADLSLLGSLLSPSNPNSLQEAAVRRLARLDDDQIPALLLDHWPSSGPAVRNLILNALLGHEPWAFRLVDRLKSGSLSPAEAGASVRQALLEHPSAAIRQSAKEIFRPVASERASLVASLAPKVETLEGHATRGQALFETHCGACHRAGELGTGAGPNLAMLYDRSVETILTAILDPNRAVEEKYWNYTVSLKNGDEFSGILLNQSGRSVTLMGITGVEQTFLRREIANLRTSNRSLMPEGFEQFLGPQELADLVAFIHSSARSSR